VASSLNRHIAVNVTKRLRGILRGMDRARGSRTSFGREVSRVGHRSAHPESPADPDAWELAVDGEVDTPLSLTLGELKERFENVTYDLVTIFEVLHDMNHPVEALRTARNMLVEGGSVLVADERVADRFNAPGDEIERFNYGWSILHCLPVGNLEEDSAATGTVIRPDTVRAYAAEAGFGHVEVLEIDNDFWRFYRLAP
jgi:SAM-dependent methyltransferase